MSKGLRAVVCCTAALMFITDACFAFAQENIVIDWNKLRELLPKSLNGAPMYGTPLGANTDVPNLKSSNVRARYGVRGAYKAYISITHLSTSDSKWSSQKKLHGMTKPSDSDWSRVEIVEIKGFSAIIALMKKQNKCTVTILLDNGISVNVELNETRSIENAAAACDAVNFDGLSALKP